MPINVVNLIKNNLNYSENNPLILVLGLTYLANVDDIRCSPSIELIKKLSSEDYKIHAHDPMIEKDKNFQFTRLSDLPCSNIYDFIVLCVAHSFYKNLEWEKWLKDFNGVLLDANNVLNNKDINKLKNLEFKLLKVGRG